MSSAHSLRTLCGDTLPAMLTPKVIEIQNLSAHRRDAPVIRPAAPVKER